MPSLLILANRKLKNSCVRSANRIILRMRWKPSKNVRIAFVTLACISTPSTKLTHSKMCFAPKKIVQSSSLWILSFFKVCLWMFKKRWESKEHSMRFHKIQSLSSVPRKIASMGWSMFPGMWSASAVNAKLNIARTVYSKNTKDLVK